jgi:hypothetical protein
MGKIDFMEEGPIENGNIVRHAYAKRDARARDIVLLFQ